MKFSFLFLLIFFTSCANYNSNYSAKKSFYSQGFAYVYDENDFKNKIVSKRFKNENLEISHSFLKPGSLIRITNPENNKALTLRINKRSSYPDFYKILFTEAVANKLKINKNVPFVEIQEIKKNESFVATKAKIFDEEKNVHNKAPVTNVKISNLSSIKKSKKNKINKFSIIIAEFYNKESAINLKNDLKLKLNNKKIYIIKSGDNKYKLLSGTYNSVNLLKNDYIVLKKYGFEDLDIKLND